MSYLTNKGRLVFQLFTGLLLVLLSGFLPDISVLLSTLISPMAINIIFRIICVIVPILIIENISEIGINRNSLRNSVIWGSCIGALFLLSHILIQRGIHIRHEDLNLHTLYYFILVMFIELPSEEILFRGFILTRLMKFMPASLANFLTSLLFLIVHIKTWSMVFVWFGSFVLSYILGYIFIKNKNIAGTIICHDLNDLGFLFLTRQGRFF